jgi:hypothetical protein|tara:strand:+ start:89 stop:415 length:327 start_codon:yes stop_codon:yes gene_type:complete
MEVFTVGLCGPGRHDIPQVSEDNFLFPMMVENPMDFSAHYNTAFEFISNLPEEAKVELYVTGFTPVLTSFLSAWVQVNDQRRRAGSSTRPLTLYHYNRESSGYEPHLF